MAVDPVPWFIQAPAEHSAEVARTLAYQAIGGKEGLARAGDLFVQALSVPGPAVQVLPGAAGILNRGSGGGGQAYVGRVGSAVTVPIAATGSGAGRSDLIVFRVQDPQYGGDVPASPEAGPYIFLDVISGVPAGTTRLQSVPSHEADTAITLARVDLPASTGTVTAGMITNVAAVANPRRERAQVVVYPTGATGEGRAIPTSAYGPWPLIGSERPMVWVPEWAEQVIVRCDMAGVTFSPGAGGKTGAGLRVAMSGATPGEHIAIIEDAASTANRENYFVVGTIRIPEALRGTWQMIEIQGVRADGVGIWRADYQSAVAVDYEFSEVG